MASNQIPTPPATDNPIVILRSMSKGSGLSYLDNFLAAHEAGDVDQAAKSVLTALAAPPEHALLDTLIAMLVGLVNDLAISRNSYPPSLTTALCRATDKGFHTHAYNAANQLMSRATTLRDFQEAERYFKIAMSFSENPEVQAAAHVNYCPIVRDGLITGTPNWPAAVEIYEAAAHMGLAKAMFNAGNVCNWLADKGDRAYGARAAYWFEYTLAHRAAGRPILDMEGPDGLDEVFESCMLGLAALHIDAKFDGADLEEGIRLAKEVRAGGNEDAGSYLGVAYIRRIRKMTDKPQKSPGGNWRSVLSHMDWTFRGDIEVETLAVPTDSGTSIPRAIDKLIVGLRDGSDIPMFVTHDACLPCQDGLELIEAIAADLANRFEGPFLLLPRKAFFIEDGGSPFTPIYVIQNGELSIQALWMGSTPEFLLQRARDNVRFLDRGLRTWTSMIPIAVNVLDEGFVVAERARVTQPWVAVGGAWRMPYADKAQLAQLGLDRQIEE